VKKYVEEDGSERVEQLFNDLLAVKPPRLMCSRCGVTEVMAALNRRQNAGKISRSVFAVAYMQLERDRRSMQLLTVRNYQIDGSARLILTHNLNSTDALHLQVALETHSRLRSQGDRLLFFCADHRLLRAAQAEGLTTFNPETGTEPQLVALLAA
jgi:predicted nucleic acid-binding protein